MSFTLVQGWVRTDTPTHVSPDAWPGPRHPRPGPKTPSKVLKTPAKYGNPRLAPKNLRPGHEYCAIPKHSWPGVVELGPHQGLQSSRSGRGLGPDSPRLGSTSPWTGLQGPPSEPQVVPARALGASSIGTSICPGWLLLHVLAEAHLFVLGSQLENLSSFRRNS